MLNYPGVSNLSSEPLRSLSIFLLPFPSYSRRPCARRSFPPFCFNHRANNVRIEPTPSQQSPLTSKRTSCQNMRSRAGKKLKSCQKRKVVPKSRSRAKQVEVVPKKGEVVPKIRSRAKQSEVVPKK